MDVSRWRCANRSTHTTDDSGERDGTNAADNTHDYIDTGSASSRSTLRCLRKVLFGTDQTETSGTDVTIGERVTYALFVTLPEGTTAGLDVIDLLPAGLNYESFQFVTTVAGSGGLLTADFNGTIQGGTRRFRGEATATMSLSRLAKSMSRLTTIRQTTRS